MPASGIGGRGRRAKLTEALVIDAAAEDWGARERDVVIALPGGFHLAHIEGVRTPANNLSVVLRRR